MFVSERLLGLLKLEMECVVQGIIETQVILTISAILLYELHFLTSVVVISYSILEWKLKFYEGIKITSHHSMENFFLGYVLVTKLDYETDLDSLISCLSTVDKSVYRTYV